MSNKTATVFIQCPICHKSGTIEVKKKEIERSPTGLTTIEIKEDICEHRFLVYVDKNFKMRESEKLDFIQSPDIVFEIQKGKEAIFDKDQMNVIKLYVYPLTLSYILKCLMFNQKIGILINDNKPFLKRIYKTLFNYLFEGAFSIDYQILPYSEFISAKNNIDLPIIIRDIDILRDQNNFLTGADLAVERGFVKKFYNEKYGIETLKALKMEIKNAFILASSIKELIIMKKKLNIHKIINFLQKQFNIKVNIRYAEFLLDILKYYYHINLKGIYKNVEFLKFKKLGK